MPAEIARKKKKEELDLDKLGLEMGNKPPQALDIEEAVLGSMLLEPDCVDEVMQNLAPKCFYDPKHKKIFEAIEKLVESHSPVDILTVSTKLKTLGDFEIVGGLATLNALTDRVGSAAHVEYYVRILQQKSIQRDLIRASHSILKDSYDESVDMEKLIDNAQSSIFDAIKTGSKRDVQELGDVINAITSELENFDSSKDKKSVPSGYPTLDSVTNGWQNSDLIILAARPSVGKTAFALNVARNAAVDYNMPVAIFSLEMSASQLAKRLMISESGLRADKIKGSVRLEPYEWQQLETKLKRLVAAPIYIDDTPGLPVMEFRTKAKALVNTKGVRLIVVDYLQLMQGPSSLQGLREQEVAAISRTLKATAKELDVPIIALSQLSRNAVQRTGSSGKPQLSDLRESGSIEQDADMVLFIHRPDYVGMAETPAGKETTQLIIAKHRNGETRDIDMLFKSEMVRFVEVSDSFDMRASGNPIPSAMNDFQPSEMSSNEAF